MASRAAVISASSYSGNGQHGEAGAMYPMLSSFSATAFSTTVW
jgi:hypothetical protein